MKNSLLLGGLALLLPLLPLHAATAKPNVLWLTSEDNSAEWVGCYGNPLARTPNIDRFASEGFRYTHVFANAPVCSPSRGAWITGIHALSLGIQPMRSRNAIPHDRIPYYPDLLQRNGYFTGNSTKTDYNIGGRSDKDCWNHPGEVKWADLPQQQPFFQVVNFTSSHESRVHKGITDTRFDPKDAVLAPYHPDLPEIRQCYAKYYDAVENMDREVGEALAMLERLGLADSTIVIYNSDHGGVITRSKRFLFENSIHCPLIIRIPEKFKHLWPAPQPGTTVDRLVSFIDMPKTWLSLTQSEIPEHIDGMIFLGDELEPERAFSFGFSDRQAAAVDSCRSVRDKRFFYAKRYMPFVPWGQHAVYTWKMAATRAWEAHHQSGQTNPITGRFFRPKTHYEELYDIENDPHCIDNLIHDAEHTEQAQRMRQALKKWQLKVRDSGMLPEEEILKRATDHGITIYDLVQRPDLYDLPTYLDAADIALDQDADSLDELEDFLTHEDAGVRYWGVIGCIIRNERAKRLTPHVQKLLRDDSETVRSIAAYHLFRVGEQEAALGALEALLRKNTYASMMTLTVVGWLGEEAKPLHAAVREHKAIGSFTKRRQDKILADFSH
ncbi:MAG: sulfatase-like hydrolase/transferase [Verrucomicrobiota bacterium]